MSDAFRLTDEQREFRGVVRTLCEDKIAPRAAQIDADAVFPHDVRTLLAANGLLGLHIPEEYGGGGADAVTFCVLIEEVARACASSSLIPGVQKLGTMPLLLAADEEQLRRWLPPLASGDELISYCLSEAGAGSDAAAMTTRARPDGEGWRLDGSKMWTTNAGVSDAYVVMAKTDPDAGARGVSAFYVRADDPGVSVGRKEDKLGIRGSPTCQVHFDGCAVPGDRLVGRPGEGFKTALRALDHTRLTIGAQAVGIAQGALDHCVGYARERRQFGRPIGSFQAVQFMLADMAIDIEAARQLVYAAGASADRGDPDLGLLSAAAKCKASDVAMAVTTDAVQVLGGYGYVSDHPVERMMRDAKITQIYEGTNQIQRLVVARRLLGPL
ncbi:MAG: acyl-CoA dehydrogenase family protein [Actinobacteria bacterium]|nr:acyl-CoA dehydrogenase family protein [Actinomycetota bacterium]